MTEPLSQEILNQLAGSAKSISELLDGRSVALAQEWIGARDGSVKVFEALAVLLSDAELFALSHEPGVPVETGGRTIATTFLDRPSLRDRRSLSLPIMPLAWRSVRGRWDLAVTSAHAFSRSFGIDSDVQMSYVHSPARYIWFPEVDSRTSSRFSNAVQAPAREILKPIDRRATRRTRWLAANSETTQERIRQVYGCESEVIHPPVDTTFYTLPDLSGAPPARDGLLALGRLVPYKRMDTAIHVAARLGQRLTLVGQGPDLERLEELAKSVGADVTFATDATDDDVRSLYRSSQALLFPGNEDFGIVPVEAQACGCPVVTAGIGGALETVEDGVTGIHARSGEVDDLVEATSRLFDLEVSTEACRRSAERFAYTAFGSAIEKWIRASLTR